MSNEAGGHSKTLSSATPVRRFFSESAFQREDGPKRLHVHLFLGGEGALGQLDFLRVHCERFEGRHY